MCERSGMDVQCEVLAYPTVEYRNSLGGRKSLSVPYKVVSRVPKEACVTNPGKLGTKTGSYRGLESPTRPTTYQSRIKLHTEGLSRS